MTIEIKIKKQKPVRWWSLFPRHCCHSRHDSCWWGRIFVERWLTGRWWERMFVERWLTDRWWERMFVERWLTGRRRRMFVERWLTGRWWRRMFVKRWLVAWRRSVLLHVVPRAVSRQWIVVVRWGRARELLKWNTLYNSGSFWNDFWKVPMVLF